MAAPVWIGPTAAELLACRRAWTVHSVFDTSVNLRLGECQPACAAAGLGGEPGTAGGSVLLHVGADGVRPPFGIDLPAVAWPRWRATLRSDAGGVWDPARGRLAGGASLDLGTSWREAVGDSGVAAGPAVFRSLDGDVLGSALPSPDAAAVGSGILTHGDPAEVRGRLAAAFDGLVAGETDAAAWLLGRGPGLTPSGDDILIGMLGALYRAGMPGRSAVATAALRRRLAGAPVTTDVSLAYLRDAALGRFAAPLRRVLLATSEPDRVAALAALRTVGHTSGADTILGLALAASRLGQAVP